MIAVVRAELLRTLTIRSSWVAIVASTALGVLFGWFSPDFWSLFAGLGAFGVSVVSVSQHYQHRTSVLLFLGEPRRLVVLAAQCVNAMVLSIVIAAVSGIAVVTTGSISQYARTLAVVPVMALFGVANATIVRRPLWLFAGYAGWLLFVEALIGRFTLPLPFSSFLLVTGGNARYVTPMLAWTAAALAGAAFAIRRDLAGD